LSPADHRDRISSKRFAGAQPEGCAEASNYPGEHRAVEAKKPSKKGGAISPRAIFTSTWSSHIPTNRSFLLTFN
jgi:hypothetical protein